MFLTCVNALPGLLIGHHWRISEVLASILRMQFELKGVVIGCKGKLEYHSLEIEREIGSHDQMTGPGDGQS